MKIERYLNEYAIEKPFGQSSFRLFLRLDKANEASSQQDVSEFFIQPFPETRFHIKREIEPQIRFNFYREKMKAGGGSNF